MNTVAKIEPEQLPASNDGSAALMRLIERAATSADLDVAKLEHLLAVKAQWEATEARKAFMVAKAAFKSEAPSLVKNKRVAFASRGGGAGTEYDYATLDSVADAVNPVLSRHDLSYSWETEQLEGGVVRVTCILTHIMGHSERVSLQAGADQSGSKNNIQAIGSTVSFLERYTLLAALGMATKGQDTDAGYQAAGPITAEQKDALIALMKEIGADTKKFLNFLGIEALDNLHASRFDFARQCLEKKRGAKP